MTLRLPLVSLPKETIPSISLITAESLGLRASKSSATRGRPPVISLVSWFLDESSQWYRLLEFHHRR